MTSEDQLIVFPDPMQAEDDGLLAGGGDLEPQTLLAAYRCGIFPWYEQGGPILWWSPDPRMVLFPGEFHCSRRLARRMRQACFEVTRDTAFAAVMRGCAGRAEGTWIHPEMMEAYQRLFDMGYAASIEVWQQGELVGGLYGVHLGRIFFAESMFSRVTDASKVALAELVTQGWLMIDCQFHTGHLQSLGAREIARAEFLALLAEGVDAAG
ncbi:MAG: leucyl/phenylalanyl-tRNA--protein transferase [Zetaproteobacteria bacterium CG06_land_8_20_14_3_00_59_53]|nr:MAG: leucyl/phenylalanyl-tRNA--protein transferase [Zetaproteobacteria bacterium CG2_30_59_37]PIO89404.1 MAG: leucyl/phenylalanyl-tRNA--protein transferase [Zetaproteobacteria bacterium CG23_combo_of_CG06-09_8_20_14_all_59_86]PIQ65376.1 MAG: leucyl/phenylalanyl-tRNA--protein transferase [Zetaproteobacteria bacterium CG11_big_fil_rev_8_21_14_0_20_59_439]PIU70702.1 MAG: leucyl/phenylalanyl-tRNA--protein transferase [Zetaproteobacteria bacterium CG06_land_8_20_14_3_00_59_53]PIU98167.1 MAG: leuc